MRQPTRCRPHPWKSLFHPTALKHRVNNAPLALPFGTIGQKNTLAQKRLQASTNTVGFWKIYWLGLQHPFDQVRLVQQIRPEKRLAKFVHPSPIKALPLRRQHIGAETDQDIARTTHCLAAQPVWGANHLRRSCTHWHTKVYFDTGAARRDDEEAREP